MKTIRTDSIFKEYLNKNSADYVPLSSIAYLKSAAAAMFEFLKR